jgi:outer membrane protein assembly factor BamB
MLQFCRSPLLVACAIVLSIVPAPAADWPQWRGPNRDGLSAETGLLQEWPADGPTLVWVAKGLGGGYTTPSVARGRVFGLGYRGEDEVAWALDEATGREIWAVKTSDADRRVGYPEGPRSTPTVDGERLYFIGAGGNLVCLDTGSGKLLWTRDLVKDCGGKMMSGWGFSESPLVDVDRVVCTPGGPQGTVAAFNKVNGDLLWQSKEITDDAAYSSLVIAHFGGKRQYVQLTAASVFGVAADTGKLLWRAPRSGRTAVIPTPILHEDLVYVTSGYGVGCNLFRVTAEGEAFRAEEVYNNKVMVNHHGGVVKVGEHLYGFSDGKGWTCQELKTGRDVWQEKEQLGKGAIGYADGRLYLRAESGPGTVVLIEATPDGFREKGRFNQPERSGKNSWPHPIIANSRLYLRDQDLLLCYDVREK